MTGITPTDTSFDPRPRLATALDQMQAQIEAVGADDLDRPTPCGDYNVRMLLGHVLAVIRKLAVAGRGGDASQVTDPADDITEGWTDAIRQARADLDQVWSADTSLERDCTLPWATMPGRDVLDTYTHEFTVHAWDLARATGRVDDLDPVLAKMALEWFSRNVPEDARSEDGAFGPAIAVADDADVFTKLAAYVGRKP
ncbi:TIGR03086 family metal-binding protein [Stackebrandtia nassauensis]|uniref:Mycothiol-dependent maleylpyruvate isomerase metal-binding domain-containing protein n=1 Tax=Stackebrandtia nassauensis (strain DSM 44728 / CIP 108903 / NRRL B-16338 / NBRC 102104 / LLR-40K-21) TaxID=446470 RepID=D3PWI5_STANL|nr:TIGR03086 family metal-binding protein [Stackebrandtia nassauensis]ADD43207.1 hypothetical protein Snas_3545 [Stackebrandtia nassauensis DSM 44728]